MVVVTEIKLVNSTVTVHRFGYWMYDAWITASAINCVRFENLEIVGNYIWS